MPTATLDCTDHIILLSQGDEDQAAADIASSKAYCFHRHCERIWDRLSAEERAAIRAFVKAGNDFDRHQRLIDHECLEVIGDIIREAGTAVTWNDTGGGRP